MTESTEKRYPQDDTEKLGNVFDDRLMRKALRHALVDNEGNAEKDN